jgi:hypothetical protein
MTLAMGAERLATAAPDQQCSLRTLGRTLERWGFTCGKGTRSQHLTETDQVVAARQRSLRQKRAKRQGDAVIRPEVYVDESYVQKNHRNDFMWYCDAEGPWVQKPTGTGERLSILHAMTKSGWVPGATLTCKRTKKTGDYHGHMHHDLCTTWFTEQLLPTIPGNALILMDNAPYPTVLSRPAAPTAPCTKDSLYTWLRKQGLPMRDDCLNAELVEMLAKLAPAPPDALDELAAEHGHEILRTPPSHPELQPMETCWAVVKTHF